MLDWGKKSKCWEPWKHCRFKESSCALCELEPGCYPPCDYIPKCLKESLLSGRCNVYLCCKYLLNCLWTLGNLTNTEQYWIHNLARCYDLACLMFHRAICACVDLYYIIKYTFKWISKRCRKIVACNRGVEIVIG